TFNPVSAVRAFKEAPRVPNTLTRAEATKLLDWADSQPLGLGLHLGAQTGLREGEILGLKWDAVDLERRSLCVRRKWNKKTKELDEFAKGQKIRTVGIYPDELLQRLKGHRRRFPDAE